ncbi:MAG: hypothetical protein ABSF46_31010 [Terriglobia bacterium]
MELHPKWEGALGGTAFQVWLQTHATAAAQPAATHPVSIASPQVATMAPGSRPAGTPAPVLAAVGVPLTRADLLDQQQFGNRIRGLINLSGQITASSDDVARLIHPEWHSRVDYSTQGFAVLTDSLEFWQALHDEDKTAELLCGARLGANAVDLVVSVADTITTISSSTSATIHGCCLFVRGVAGFTKILLEMRDKDSA